MKENNLKNKVQAVAFGACLVVFVVLFVFLLCHQKSEAKNFVQSTNENGIADDLSGNPYFMSKIVGYRYSKPKRIEYYSNITDTYRHARVLLPADYDSSKKYPVLYLLHGMGGSDKTWINKNADIIIQNLHYLNGAPEMVVVFANSCVNKEENTDKLSVEELVKVYDLTGDDLVNNLMPYINEHYSVYTDRDNTAIAGYSMGGREAVYTAFNHQELFSYLGSFSAVSPIKNYEKSFMPIMDDLVIDEQYGGFHYILLNVGRDDNYKGAGVYVIDEVMTQNGIVHDFYEMDGGHQNSVWQNALYNFGQRIFK